MAHHGVEPGLNPVVSPCDQPLQFVMSRCLVAASVNAFVLSRRSVVKVAVGLMACLAGQILLGCTQIDPPSHSRSGEMHGPIMVS